MNLGEVIGQLQSLKENSKSFSDEKEPDSIWHKDIEALDIAIEILSNKKATDRRQAKSVTE